MRLIRLLDLPAVPWRNGGGVTREIAACRDPALHPDFLWRISMATVNAPGPFSRFDGVDRSIAVLEGNGLALEMEGGEHVLTPATTPFAFPGEAPVQARLLGPTSDLNTMTRRGYFVHTMRRMVVDEAADFVAEAVTTVLVFMGSASVGTASQTFATKAMEAIVGVEVGTTLELAATDGPATIIAVEIHQAS